ncbi:MAG: SIMPL domain-containing protein [Candidatus Pacearchaeota archaeon]|nr:SIMPL domain-containing protein [Candidatus Pacearchaeota archaeon]
MTKQNQTIIATAIVSAVILIVALSALFVFKPASSGNTVSVQGSSVVSAMPDEIVVYFSIETKDKTSTESKDANSEILDIFIEELEKIGFERNEIVTENYNIYPNYNWDDGDRTEDGFTTSHSISVKINSDDIDTTGRVVDAGVNAGAIVNYINFELSEDLQKTYKAQAMELAAQDAKTKAEALAAGFDKSVGKLVSVSIGSYNYYPLNIYSSTIDMAEGSSSIKEAVTNIQPGEQEVSATVTAVYSLK